MEAIKYLYRYERGMADGYTVRIYLEQFFVLRTTPKGFWIIAYSRKRWVSADGKKRFAYPTTDEAYHNFIKRTELCIAILENRIKSAKKFLKAQRPLTVNKLV